MAEDGGVEETEPYGKYVDAEDLLGERPDDDEESSEGESESEDESETDESEADESESESGSGTESETTSGSETESETETEAETTEGERSTAAGDCETPRTGRQPVDGGETRSRTPPPAGESAVPASETAVEGGDQAPDGHPSLDAAALRPSSSWSLPPPQSRSASREGAPFVPVEDARASGSEPAPEGQGDPAAFTLPPAVSRNSSRECSRKSSHYEASTSGAGFPQSPSSLPPINQRSSSGPSRKGSNSSSQGAAATRRSQAPSPKQSSPPRNPIAVPHYYKPPPPPPPPPKPKPRERHDVSAVDPMFLQTAVYRTVPNVGKVYDWKLQHEVNAALSKQRKQQVQMGKVLEAARVQLQVREANERAFQQWVAAKEQEKQQQQQQNRRIAYVTSVYHNLVKEDPLERKARESLWVSNFAYPTSGGTPPRLTRDRVSESSERFRL